MNILFSFLSFKCEKCKSLKKNDVGICTKLVFKYWGKFLNVKMQIIYFTIILWRTVETKVFNHMYESIKLQMFIVHLK